MPIWSTTPATGAWCATASCPSALFKPASARCRCASPGCAIAVRPRPLPRFGSRRRSCPATYAAPAHSRSSCPGYTSRASRAATSARRSPRFSDRTPRGLSAATISRLKEAWQGELQAWQGRDLTDKRYVYVWVDGVYFNARLDQERQCILVVIGADEQGRKELVGLTDGYRESEQSWRELLVDLRHRGLGIGPELAIGDGNLGFWKALRQVYGAAREQRCWVHKTANVLNKLPNGVQAKAKQHLHAIWMAETREAAEAAFDHFVDAYGAKYDKAAACLVKDREPLLAFYDFPAEHWKHIRTTNPVESTFATVRLRTTKTKGCLSRRTALTMVFRLCHSAQRRWRRLDGPTRLADVVCGVRFVDGEPRIQDAA
jgi:putative transposase